MAVIADDQRDLEGLRSGVEEWLPGHWSEASEVAVTDVGSFAGGGVSNETIRVSYREAGDGSRPQELVLRFPPKGVGVFPTYDLAREHRIQRALRDGGIPAPGPVVYEADTRWLGDPFIAMPLIHGRVPEAQPRPYTLGGWLPELPADAQHKILMSFTDLMADIHRLDAQAIGITALGPAESPAPQRTLEWWLAYLEWAAEGNDHETVAPVRACFDWCATSVPTNVPPSCFVWGDAKIGNVVFDDAGGVAAALDWEMATIGPAELDLGFHLAHRRNMLEQIEGDELPELPGFPSVEEQLDRYQERLGRELADLQWYEVLNAAGLGTCRLAVQRALRVAGRPVLPGQPIRRWTRRIVSLDY
jgi:aminoglycoside phosphotransferase (APT) family kinase protein